MEHDSSAPQLKDWLEHMHAVQGLAKNTCIAYEQRVRLTLHQLPAIELVTTRDLRAHIVYERSRGSSPETVAMTIKAIRAYLKWARTHGNGAPLPIMPQQRVPTRRLPRALSEKQCYALVHHEEAKPSWLGARNAFLWVLMWATGMRISEALSLRWKDFGRDTLIVRGKGGKERMLPVLPRVWDAGNNMATAMPVGNVNDDSALFLTEQLQPMGPRDAQRAFETAAALLELPPDATPHSLRHSFATQMLASGKCSLRDVQELLGHASISTTQIYTQILPDKLLEAYDAAHPRA